MLKKQIINRAKAGKQKSPLSNRQRWWIWYQWIEGRLKPRRTRGAPEYVSEWESLKKKESTRLGGLG